MFTGCSVAAGSKITHAIWFGYSLNKSSRDPILLKLNTNDYLYIDPCYSESLLCTCYNHPYYQEQYDIQPFYRTDVKNDIHENFVSSKNYTDI